MIDPEVLGRPTDEELVSSIGAMIDATVKLRATLVRTLEANGLPGPYFAVLIRLIRAPDERLPMTRLAGEMDYTGGGMTRLTDRMERDGMVRRVPDALDRRYVYAELTAVGRERIEQVWPVYIKRLRSLLDVLSPSQLRTLAELTSTLRDQP